MSRATHAHNLPQTNDVMCVNAKSSEELFMETIHAQKITEQ